MNPAVADCPRSVAFFALAAATLLLLGVSCSERSSIGEFQVDVYDDLQQDTVAERHHGTAYFSRLAATQPQGLYVYLELDRSEGGAVLEMDLAPGTAAPKVVYLEYDTHGEPSFRAGHVAGIVALPAASCNCDDGQFDLILQDAGPDNRLETADDTFRRLALGRFSSTGAYCYSTERRTVERSEGLRLRRLHCPTRQQPTHNPSHSGEPPSRDDTNDVVEVYDPYPVEVGCGAEVPPAPPPEYDDEGGCGGQEPPEQDYETEGCEGDTYEDESGCEADDSSSSYDEPSCEGDAHAATSKPDKARARLHGLPIRTLPLLLAIFAVVQRFRRRR